VRVAKVCRRFSEGWSFERFLRQLCRLETQNLEAWRADLDELRSKSLGGRGFAAGPPYEIFRKIAQNLSPAGVRSPFVARQMPTDCASVVPVSGR
jgi:hypothetical protein